ncbi:hypothetical protein [Shigella flexneri]|uniref:hypothetical protein n=1 Tax=Shigella flexneri TaxID=623 RepID=UPI00374D5072
MQRKISKMAELAIELDDMTIITEKLRDMKNALSKLNHDIEEDTMKWHTEFGHLNRGDMLTSEQHRCSNEKKKF